MCFVFIDASIIEVNFFILKYKYICV
jgi:hypothetical protein